MSLYNIFNNILGSTIATTNSGAVSSVAGKTGAVSLVSNDITNFQPSVSLNTDVVNSKNIIQKLDTSINTIDEIKPAIGGLINLGSALQTFKEGHFNFLKSVEVHTDIIRVKTLGGGTNLEISNDQGQGIILESGQNGVVNFTGFAYNNGTGKYLKLIDQNGKIGVGTVIDAPTNTNINAIPRFSNTGGQLKNSNVSISDTGRLTAAEIDARILPNLCDGLLLKGDITPEFKTDVISIGSANAPISYIYSNSINCSGLKFNNLVGPGTLRIDANGNVSVLLDPLAPAIITPHNLTSATSDPNFTVNTSSVWQGDEAGLGGWRCFDEASTNGYHSSAQHTYSNGVQVTGAIAPMPTSGSWIAAVFSSDRTVTKIRYKAFGVNIPADFTVARFNGTTWIDTGFSVTNAIQNPGVYLEYTIPGANGGGGVWRGIALIVSRVSLPDTGFSNCLSIQEIDFQ